MPLSISPIAPAPSRRNPATLTHFQATFNGLATGIYRSKDIYARYVSICREHEVQPQAPQHFGRQMTAAGYISTRNSTGTTRCWIIYSAADR